MSLVEVMYYLRAHLRLELLAQVAYGSMIYFALRSAAVWYQGSERPPGIEQYEFMLIPVVDDITHRSHGAGVGCHSFCQLLLALVDMMSYLGVHMTRQHPCIGAPGRVSGVERSHKSAGG